MTVSSSHPLVGVWKEKKNPEYTTPCVLTITVEDGQFSLREVDESDGVVLRISDISWDGERLHFVTLFPPTKHKASHIFSLIRKGIAAHQVSYSDEDGNHTIDEIWKKARKKE